MKRTALSIRSHLMTSTILDIEFESIPSLINSRSTSDGSRTFIRVLNAGKVSTIITFSDLRVLVSKSASLLRSNGIVSGMRVGLWAVNSLTYIISLLGIQWIGAIPFPINTALPPELVGAMLKSAACSMLLVGSERLSHLPEILSSCELSAIVLGDSSGAKRSITLPLIESGAESLAADSRAEDMALILHTSGTRTIPKLVPLTHRNLIYNREAVRQHWSGLIEKSDSTLGWMPFYHVIGFAHDFLGDLYYGCCYNLAELPSDRPANVDDVLANLLVAKPSILYCVPWMLEQMKPAIEKKPESAVLQCLQKLKLLMSGKILP